MYGVAFLLCCLTSLGICMCRNLFTLLTALILSFLTPVSARAFDLLPIESAGLDLGVGYRSDKLDWSISNESDGGSPDILSELTWDNLHILQLQGTGWLELGELPFLRRNSLLIATISLGKIYSGDAQDSDYARDGRTHEWSRSVSDADHGMTADFSAAFGPIFELKKAPGLSVTPLIGYAFNMQALKMSDGEQVISDSITRQQYFPTAGLPPPVGKISGLDSTYTAYWYGPWLGLNTDYQVSKKFKMTAGIEYHWVDYFAQADWNLRSDFDHPVSFEHDANGTGVVWNFKGRYLIDEKWSWLLKGNIQRWKTNNGTDRTYFDDGTVGNTRLNKVTWHSYALTTGLEYLF